MSFSSSKGEGERVSSSGMVGAGAAAQIEAFLGKGSKVVGTLTFTGPADLDGYVEGEVNAKERLTIGEAAVINARITGADIVVKGTVTGDIIATKRLALKKPARITGNISSANLSIEEGVIFEGKCSMNVSAAQSSDKAGDGKSANVKPPNVA